MPRERILIEGWPTLLPAPMAARYLSLDDEAFDELVDRYAIHAVEPAPGEFRWKRADLDRLLRRLPAAPHPSGVRRRAVIELGDDTVQRIAAAFERRLIDKPADDPKAVLTVRKTTELLCLSKSSIYRMIEDGRLETRRVGGRRLIRRRSVELLLEEAADPR